MILFVEGVILCLLFTLMVLVMAKNPIKTLYNYPPKIQNRVKELKEYEGKIPTNQDKVLTKVLVSIIIVIVVSLILKYVNGYTTFKDCFLNSIFLWTVVNVYDVIILDICWFCQSKRFMFKGTEDMIKEYKNYWFHIKEGLIGEIIGLILCIIISLIVAFIL